MDALPDALFVIDVGHEEIAVHEAKKLGIPVVAVVDTNYSPDGIDYVIPGNDDAMRAIQLYAAGIADAVLEGRSTIPEVAGRRGRVRRARRGRQAAARRARARRRRGAAVRQEGRRASPARPRGSARRVASVAAEPAAELIEADPEESAGGVHGAARGGTQAGRCARRHAATTPRRRLRRWRRRAADDAGQPRRDGGRVTMAVTAEAVKELRERTGAGMMECKKALVEANGDLDAAAEIMRKSGSPRPTRRPSRVAAEGVIAIEQCRRRQARRAGRGQLRDRLRRARGRLPRLRRGRGQGGARRAAGRSSRRSLRVKLASGRDRRGDAPRADRARSARTSACAASSASRAPARWARYLHGTRIGVLVELKAATTSSRGTSPCTSRRSTRSSSRADDVPADLVAKEREIVVAQIAGDRRRRASRPRSSPRWSKAGAQVRSTRSRCSASRS